MLSPRDILHNRYRIEALLGEGGMGAVYFGHDETLMVSVAIKENLVVSAASQRQFEREARLLAGLRHPHLPRVTDHFIIPGQGQYLVMDFVEGEALSERLAGLGPLSEAEAQRLAGDVLGALCYLHSQYVIHRDIKPANIKITPDGRAILVDFGIAKIVGAGQTTTGARGLTPGFAPPEQYGLGGTDLRSDLYSFGATLYNALTGCVPAEAFGRLVGNAPLTPVRSLEPSVSEQTAQAIEKSLALAADDRWPSAEAMRLALQPATTPSPQDSAPLPTIVLADAPELRIEGPAKGSGIGDQGLGVSRQAAGPYAAGVVPPPIIGPPIGAPSSSQAVSSPQSRTARSVTAPRPWRRVWVGFGLVGLFGISGLVVVAVAAWLAIAGRLIPLKGGGATQPAILPLKGAGRLALVSDRDGDRDIYLINADGSSLINLTNNTAEDFQPAFSPSGRKIAFVRDRNGNNDVYLMDADGTNVVNMTNNPADDIQPAFSPDGGEIAFVSNRDGNPEIYVATQSGISRYTNNPADDLWPSWSHNRAMLAFASNRDGNYEIYVIGPDGLRRYTHDPDGDTHPRWSPEEDILAFEANRSGNYEIYVFGSTGLTRYTDNPTSDRWPAWSADGSRLAFVSERDGNPEIYFIGPGGLSRVTHDPARDTEPAWQP